MPNASTTQASSACETRGTPIPIAYGYNLVTGKRDVYWQLQNTGSSSMDYHRVGKWLLGHGEWDGCSELYINDVLVWVGDQSATAPSGFSGQSWVKCLDNDDQPMVFNFHSGCDTTIGSSTTPSSSGPDQGMDILNAQLPSAVQRLFHSRIAYYTIMRKQPVQNQTSTKQSDPAQWTDISPVGLWRGLKVRLFNASGVMTGYAFSTNPAWQIVDILLRRKLFPDYSLTITGGPEALPDAVSARFNWESIYESAQYFDTFLSNGRRRFTGNFAFSNATSLQAILSKMLLNCRSFLQEDAGQIYLICDNPRSVSFTFTADHILPGSWQASDRNLDTASNCMIAQYRELLVPACATIASITATNQANPTIVTEDPHCLNQGDRIAIGGTDTVYDGTWEVASVPDATNVGTPYEVDPTSFTVVRKGANYPTSVGSGGKVGLLYSRFNNRYPQFWHKNNMLARGAVGLGIARRREKVKETLDLSTTTYDQASRIARYERDRRLGLDQSPYVTPSAIRFRTSLFAKDASGNLVAAVRPGDRITLDPTVNWNYQGDYEVLEPLTFFLSPTQSGGESNAIGQTIASDLQEVEFNLGPYSESYMYDSSDDDQAGWPVVPGSDPGNDSVFTSVDLANGGNFVFFSGQLATGSQFQLPSTGYPSANMLAWVGPAGTNVNYHSMRVIQSCTVDSYRNLTLIYSDCIGNTWGGDLNYAALTWLSTDTTFAKNGITWLELTLLGGETILFGKGIIEDGTTLELPDGYDWTDSNSKAKAFAVAFPHDSVDASYNSQSVGAYVDSSHVVHFDYIDSSSSVYPEPRNASVLIFAWKNNGGTATVSSETNSTWVQFTLTNGKVFGVGCGKSMSNGASFGVPSAADNSSSVESITGSSNGRIIGGHHAQGVGTCYLDSSKVVHITFNDGSGDVWDGEADVLAVFCAASTAESVLVSVSPAKVSMGQAATRKFTATVSGATNTSVTWSVDGIAGGNSTVGTVDLSGNYISPLASGSHTITATSASDTSASGSVSVTVTAAQTGVSLSVSSDGSAVTIDSTITKTTISISGTKTTE